MVYRSDMREYRIWIGIRRRCNDPRVAAYSRYGARGISIAPEWQSDFDAFYTHVGPAPSNQHSLDRIDNTGNYVPGNVRWASKKEQANNRSTNSHVAVNGVQMTLTQAGESCGLHAQTVRYRIAKGQSPTGPRRRTWRKQVTFKGRTQSVAEWSAELGVPVTTINWRLSHNKPIVKEDVK